MSTDMHSETKKLFIKTYGCQMNVYDSVRMADVMKPLGFSLTDTPEGADMVILNTCHIREKAAEKMYSELGRIRPEKIVKENNGSTMIIAVAGCVGQAEGEEVFRRAPFVDVVVGPQSYHNLPELVARATRERGHFLNLDFPPEPKFDALPEDSQPQGVSAFLAIQEGCDKFCTFCVVPYTRGAEYSRPVSDIYREAQRMAVQGAQEITLLGQNVNAYHGMGESAEDIWPLGKLIRHIATIPQVKRIRYTTSHPRDMQDELIEAHATIPKLMPFLHLPIQSGSDKILKAMNRKHGREDYMQVIAKLRAARPDMAFSSDFIVGFPGETEEDFSETLAIVREVGYAQCYSFAYSPRPGTPASIREEQVPQAVKLERLARLQAAITEEQFRFNQQTVGKTMEVLLDRAGKYEGQTIGRSPYMQSVHVRDASAYKNTMVTVKITEAFEHSVAGVITSIDS